MSRLLLTLTAAAVIAGCGSSSSNSQSATDSPSVTNARTSSPTSAATPKAQAASSKVCPAAGHALDGVYHPSRLTVLSACKHATGRVAIVRHEQDGDLHIDVALDPAYRGLLAPANNTRQHGDLVVEFMARDGGHLPQPSVGDRISLTGAWVSDGQHGDWHELHPVWAVSLNGTATHTSGPRFGGSPTGDRSYNAAADCRTASGARCQGYGVGTASDEGESAPKPRRTTSSSGSGGGSTSSGNGCEPGYSPCLPRTGDLNCADIPADKKPVTVTGSDPYGLDRDHNGVGCQSG
jgi:hypothetical protein